MIILKKIAPDHSIVIRYKFLVQFPQIFMITLTKEGGLETMGFKYGCSSCMDMDTGQSIIGTIA